ncbi:MAG: CDP-alcohol phosphatidyltransferase family protein [Verrucomicrobiota bacterium]
MDQEEKPEQAANVGYFGDKERSGQAQFSSWRTDTLGPIFQPWIKRGLKADHLTIAGVLTLIPYAYSFGTNVKLAAILVWVYVAFDGLDGIVARVAKTANGGGALADVFADQMGMVVTVLLLIGHDLVNPVLACLYCALYLTMIASSVLQNFLGIPMQTLLRSKYILYGAVGIYAFFNLNLFHWIMIVFSITMTVNCLQSFFRLRKHLSTYQS